MELNYRESTKNNIDPNTMLVGKEQQSQNMHHLIRAGCNVTLQGILETVPRPVPGHLKKAIYFFRGLKIARHAHYSVR